MSTPPHPILLKESSMFVDPWILYCKRASYPRGRKSARLYVGVNTVNVGVILRIINKMHN